MPEAEPVLADVELVDAPVDVPVVGAVVVLVEDPEAPLDVSFCHRWTMKLVASVLWVRAS